MNSKDIDKSIKMSLENYINNKQDTVSIKIFHSQHLGQELLSNYCAQS